MVYLLIEARKPFLLSAAIVAVAAFLGGIYLDSLGVSLIASASSL